MCDENGKARGGQPGNQTGKELRIQPYYENKKGWVILRAFSNEVAEKLAYDMTAACENMAIGYNQSRRNTLFTAARPFGFDCAKVETPCECDCSSLVRVCLAYAGITVRDFNTSSELARLMATGAFQEVEGELCTGDILVTKTKGHTCIVTKGNPRTKTTHKYVKVVGGSVRVREGNGTSYPSIGIVHRGDEFPFVEQEEREPYWYKILYGAKDGYISCNERYTKVIDKW